MEFSQLTTDDYLDHPNAPVARPRIWTVLIAPFAALLVSLLLQVVIGVVLAIEATARGVPAAELAERLTDSLTTPAIFMLVIASAQVAFGLAAIVPAWLSPTPARQRLGLVKPRQPWTIYPLTMIGSFVPLAIALAAAQGVALFIPGDPTTELLYEKMTLDWAPAFVLFIALAPGFCEELLFRGYVQRRLLQRWRPWTAIVATSIFFAIMHISPPLVVLALLLGVWFGVIAWRTGSVGPSIACHAFVNGSLNLFYNTVKFAEITETVQWAIVAAALVAGLACFIIACRQLAGNAALPTYPT